jgi:tetratricopeptide (TPR) repeat protein
MVFGRGSANHGRSSVNASSFATGALGGGPKRGNRAPPDLWIVDQQPLRLSSSDSSDRDGKSPPQLGLWAGSSLGMDGTNAATMTAGLFDDWCLPAITESVVGAIEPNLQRAEIERLKQRPAGNLDAYDLLLLAHQLVYEFTPDSLTAALEYLKRSLAIDPHYAPATAMTAYCYNLRRYQSWAKEIEAEAAEAIRLSLRAVELASDDANVLWMAGMAIWPLPGELRRGKDWVRRSLEINPNSAMALTVMGWIEAVGYGPSYGRDKEKALQLLTHARRLSPRDPSAWFTFGGLAIAYFGLARYEESVAAAETALSHNPRYAFALRFLAAGLVMLGRRERAREVAQLILKVEPGVTVARLRARHPDNVDLQTVNIYWDALGAAGIPE